ncbi:MAG: hypothetical protein ACREIF_12455 [Chthoniobacterales bacterium]
MFGLQLQIKFLFLLPPAVFALFASGCASAGKSGPLAGTTGGWYSVVAEKTPFYHYGPQQGNGPDAQLPKDSIMKIIRPSFGYVKVQLQDGESGYVASEDIRPAAATLVAEKLAPPTPQALASQSGEFGLDSNDPRLIAPPEPLPESSPTPAFRY